MGLWNTLTLTNSLGAWASQYRAITSRSGPSARRGTGKMRMPRAASRANSTDQPGSSTITGSPAFSSVRLTMSSAWVAPTVVMIWRVVTGMWMAASRCASTSRRAGSPMGSPYLSEWSCSSMPLVARRTAAAMKLVSSQSGGNTPAPGCGLLDAWWNMPRIRAVALICEPLPSTSSPSTAARPFASFLIASCVCRTGARGLFDAISRTKKPRCLRASTRPCASSWS